MTEPKKPATTEPRDDWELIDDPTEAAIKRNQHRSAFGYAKYDPPDDFDMYDPLKGTRR